MGHSRPLYHLFLSFLEIIQLVNMFLVIIANDRIQTADLCCQNRLLYQVCHSHCPKIWMFVIKVFIFPMILTNFSLAFSWECKPAKTNENQSYKILILSDKRENKKMKNGRHRVFAGIGRYKCGRLFLLAGYRMSMIAGFAGDRSAQFLSVWPSEVGNCNNCI